MTKRTYITDFTGICNRLEALILAFAIRERHGHQICLAWPECDTLQVQGVKLKSPGLFAHLNRIKIRDHDPATFATLSQYRHVWIRGLFGAPDDLADACLQKVVSALSLPASMSAQIRDTLHAKKAPIVGVHLRRGDFKLGADKDFNLALRRHSAVPDWLLLHAMEQLKQRCPETKFLLCGTGSHEDYQFLLNNFDCFFMETESPYTYKGQAHASRNHPVADLFALACCSVVLATPRSSFSHWAANVLGEPATVIMPPSEVRFNEPRLVKCKLGRCRLPTWLAASERNVGTQAIQSPADLPLPTLPQTAWLA